MKFGYFCNMTNWDHRPYNQLVEQVREIAVHCDQNSGILSGLPSIISTTRAWTAAPVR